MTQEAQETTPKTALMSYRSKNKVEEIERELEELERQASGEVQEEPAETPTKEEEPDKGLSAEEQTFKKRYGDLRRYQQEQQQKLEAKIKELEDRMSKAPASGSMPKTKEQIEAWVKKYPDVAAIVRGLAGEEASHKSQEIDRRLKEIEEMSSQIALEKAENEIRKTHPDFDDIRDSDAFHDWAKEQPTWVQNALYDDIDVRATSRVIDLYKADKGIKRVAPDKAAALSVSTRSRANTPQADESANWWSESKVSKLSDKEYAENEEAILKSMRDGKFKYDLSRKSR